MVWADFQQGMESVSPVSNSVTYDLIMWGIIFTVSDLI